MFEGRKRYYHIEKPVFKEDSFNYGKKSYIDRGTASIYIAPQDRTNTLANDLNLYQSTLVGYTNDEIDRGYVIDGKYEVLSVMPHRQELVLYLQEIEDGK